MPSRTTALLPFLPEHRLLLRYWVERPHVLPWWGDPEEAYHLCLAPCDGGHALIAAEGRAVGYVHWQRITREEIDEYKLYELPEGIVDIDILIGDEEALGKGIATQALKLLTEELFADPSIKVLCMGISVENHASLRVAEKAGFFRTRIYESEEYGKEYITLCYPPPGSRPPITGLAIFSPRLHLRPWRLDEVDAFHAIWGDPEVIWWGKRHDREHSRLVLERILGRTHAMPFGLGWWSVTRQDTDEIIGNVVLQHASFHPAPELGYHFRPTGWGQGFATEASQVILHHAFETLRLPVVSSIVALHNHRSHAIMKRLGFAPLYEREYAEIPHLLYEKHACLLQGDPP